jgi:MraZ protein
LFKGRFEHTIDAKGRVSIPSRFREILASRYEDDRLIVTSFLEPCLLAYPVAEWQALEERVRELPRFDPAVVRLKRVLVSGATECPIDKNGRILIPPVLRDLAGLEREMIWAGMVDNIEIWSRANWQQMFEQARGKDLAEAMGKLGL